MKRTHPQTVAEIISNLLKKENLQSQWDEHRALDIWPEIVGPGINRYTTHRTIRNGVITVWLSSAPLRNEMMLSRSLLIKKINEQLGQPVINEIIFK
ncbi:MAG: DUF721 domain-containing protein [Muribaculaceae bacterium]|nr:DUF721 domain-containing protein [Muribaculaceae bacterium]